MKKLMLVTVVTFASVSALASKARLNSLQNAQHVQDIQEVWQREPDQAVNYEAATVEFGGNQGTDPEAEGGFIRKMGDSAWSLYLGRSSTTYLTSTNLVANTLGTNADEIAVLNSAFNQTNPLQLTYAGKSGDIAWGAGLFYVSNKFTGTETYSSGAETMDANVEQNVGGVLVGANNGVWDAQARIGFVGKTELKDVSAAGMAGIAAATDIELESTSSYKVSGGYRMDTMYYYGSYEATAGELKINGTKQSDATASEIVVGAINSMKKEGTDFFYGASVVMTENDDDTANTNVKTTTVPVIVGIESEINTWLTLRGALTQPISLLSSTKVKGQSSATVADATQATVGAGFKWGRATIDTVLGTGGTGTFGLDDDGDNFAQIGMTYNF